MNIRTGKMYLRGFRQRDHWVEHQVERQEGSPPLFPAARWEVPWADPAFVPGLFSPLGDTLQSEETACLLVRA